MTPQLVVTGCGPTLQGFTYWWLKYIRDFDCTKHCAACFRGPFSKRVTNAMALGVPLELDEATDYRFLYLCGVSRDYAPRYLSPAEREAALAKNFHLAMRPKPGAVATAMTANGFRVVVRNAEALPIPPLPAEWRHLPRPFTRCRNFHFAVAHGAGALPPSGTQMALFKPGRS